ncbi:ammonia-forming cytochrome c nitrite reductase subunit c552 [Denitrobacterium detoxificans]|jgi:nitrite reductase (cytochrome c-552)|uniref:ammonia-forming cytochrome c nitrite reductase subunit c552 n=1 Tax=Denitrobacterium detoxificans TaxID=79604 RepID=UPI0026EFDA65|nr:ammonia-forming cytochrome c nitrite reductase subunit c552 [Denitrobacterium detoxificans]MBE6466664.1 ammonia-forming cytochrome c nitrite reductase subunit c552 [Denitrobacterium detoxificans]
MFSKKLAVTMGTLAVVAIVAGTAACAPKATTNPVGNPTPNVQQSSETPTPDQFGVVKADQWANAYPYEYDSYLANATNTPPAEDYLEGSYCAEGYTSSEDTTSALPDGYEYTDANKQDYLETNPEIKTLGKGYGYAKYYTEPASHVFSLWTVAHNGRVGDGTKTKAACITCKSPQYSNLVDQEGEEVHSQPFNDIIGQLDENISCASCHGNTPMKDGEVYLEVDRAEWVRAMGADHQVASMEGQVCGQCHCDYSMAPGTSIPTSPYDNGRSDMVPEKAIKWYNDHNYVDWTYASTGAKMLAIRHAEYEFIYGGDNEILPQGSHMAQLGYDCNDCHMATTKAEDGTVYADHEWTSPLDNQELIDRDCSTCHADIRAEVRAWQNEIDPATTTLGERCEKFIKNFESKVATEQDDEANPGQKVLKLDEAFAASNGIDADTLARLQQIQRESCYYWNLAAAENSEGAHNPTYYRHTLDLGNQILDEGDALLGMSSVA